MRIRWRLALYGAAVTGAAMLVFGILLGLLVNSAAPSDQDDNLAELAGEAAATFGAAAPEQLAAAPPLITIDLADSTEPYVALLEPDGTVVYSTGQVAGLPPRIPAAVVVEAAETGESRASIFPSANVELRVHARALPDGSGIAVAGQSAEFVQQQLAGLWAVIVIAGIVTMLAALVVSWLVSGRAMRPLRRLAETTDEIGETGDLSRRLPAVKARDEVGRLTASFNAMLDRLQTAQRRLAGALEAQRRFVADASHELRSPLTTIRNNAGFLVERPDAGDTDRREAIADVAAEAERMTGLVDDLLYLAHADAGRQPVREPVELAALLADTARRAAGVVVDAPGPAVVLGDPEALGRLVWILVDNARKHGGGQVAARTVTDDGHAQLSVADEGAGIPEADLDRVFERFYRADPARSPEGSGLGLAIAHEIVAAHGGTITAANRPEGGLLVTVRLPLADANR